jgi:hypothetical protein
LATQALKQLSSEGGFSALLTILIVAFCAMAMGTALLQENQSSLVNLKVRRTLTTEFNDLVAELNVVLSSYDACKSGLIAASLPQTLKDAVAASVNYPDGRPLASPGGKYYRLAIDNVQLLLNQDADISGLAAGRPYDLYTLLLTVSFSGASGARTQHTKKIPLWIYRDGSGTVLACHSTGIFKYPSNPATVPPSFIATSIEQHSCLSASDFNQCMDCQTNGSPYSWCTMCRSIGKNYDPVTQACSP